MMALESRSFGAIEGGTTEAVAEVQTGNGRVEARLSIARPAQLTQEILDQVDVAVEYLPQLDDRLRQRMLEELKDERTVPGQVLSTVNDLGTGAPRSAADFVRSLRIESVLVTPDGGTSSPDRMTVVYRISAGALEQRFAGIVREGEGAVFAEVRQTSPGHGVSTGGRRFGGARG